MKESPLIAFLESDQTIFHICPEREKYIALVMDEMHIKEDIVYDKHTQVHKFCKGEIRLGLAHYQVIEYTFLALEGRTFGWNLLIIYFVFYRVYYWICQPW